MSKFLFIFPLGIPIDHYIIILSYLMQYSHVCAPATSYMHTKCLYSYYLTICFFTLCYIILCNCTVDCPKSNFQLRIFWDISREYPRYYMELKPWEYPRYYMALKPGKDPRYNMELIHWEYPRYYLQKMVMFVVSRIFPRF